MRRIVSSVAVLFASSGLFAQSPKVHRLEATPDTVAYGFYWSEAKPVLRIASGDIIDVDTLLTSTPDRLEKAGVPASEIQASLRAIVEQVKDRGPGGHILTGMAVADLEQRAGDVDPMARSIRPRSKPR